MLSRLFVMQRLRCLPPAKYHINSSRNEKEFKLSFSLSKFDFLAVCSRKEEKISDFFHAERGGKFPISTARKKRDSFRFLPRGKWEKVSDSFRTVLSIWRIHYHLQSQERRVLNSCNLRKFLISAISGAPISLFLQSQERRFLNFCNLRSADLLISAISGAPSS